MNESKLEPAGVIEGNAPAPVADIIGPGKTKPGGIKIKADPKQGKRLSSTSKIMIGSGLTLLGGLIIFGIITAGNKSTPPTEEATNSTLGIGMTKPPAPTASQVQFAVRGISAPPTSASAPAPKASSPGTALTAGTTTLQPGQPEALTPAQKYHQWLEEQHYKELEGLVLARESAHVAKVAVEGVNPPLAQPENRSHASSVDDLIAMQRKALQMQSPQPDATRLLASLGSANADNASSQDAQARNREFLNEQRYKENSGYLLSSVQPPIGQHELFAGSIIPAVLQTGIDSDLPGTITAQVRQTVYDSLHPDVVLIPQGTKIIGEYSSDIAYGQQRVLVVWNRLIFPNGATIDLKGMSGADGIGQAGFHDQVDNHYFRIFGSAILMSLLGVGAQLSQPQNSNILTAPSAGQQAAAAMAEQLNSVGTNLLNKNLSIQPTLHIRPGYLFNVLVNRTIILPPYQG